MKKVFFPIHTAFLLLTWLTLAFLNSGCTGSPSEVHIPGMPEPMDSRVSKDIRQLLEFCGQNNGRLNDTIRLQQDSLTADLYARHDFQRLWSREESWLPVADSLYQYIRQCEDEGLFPSDYHFKSLTGHRLFLADSLGRKDPQAWGRADLLMTDAFLLLAKHLQVGRLDRDSVTLRKDSTWPTAYYDSLRLQASRGNRLPAALASLEPRLPQYDSLKLALRAFLDTARPFRRYTHLDTPVIDSADFYRQLQRRLFEEDILLSTTDSLSRTGWENAIRRYQEKMGVKKPNGKLSQSIVTSLNNTNWEKFIRIAINLDRLKQLPDSMPEKYLWVNIPSYYLELWEKDTVLFRSRIVVGKPETSTPLLTGAISNMITYPQWSIPTSIVVKEIIPGMRKDTGYLTKHGFVLVNGDGQEVPPHSINWWKYNKGIPYRVIQGSGDDNALGIMKFNFSNRYSVYLHDTNQRYLFSRTVRSLSHGCVRVQEWKKLAFFLLKEDSVSAIEPFRTADSVRAWLGRKEKHWVPVRNRLPLFIRYLTCEARNGRLYMYDDVYGYDELLRNRKFADKPVQ